MTQALNLANFANNLNTAGATSNSGLQNSSVTVTAGTGMSGGGAVALGSSVTLTNAGVTSVAAGTGISVSASTGGVTISASGGSGVTSAVAGNGVAVSAATGAVTFSASAPSAGSVGSYAYLGSSNTTACSVGSTKAGSGLRYVGINMSGGDPAKNWGGSAGQNLNGTLNGGTPSGTWRCMGYDNSQYAGCCVYIFGSTLYVRTV